MPQKNEIKRGWYVLRAISGKEAKVQELLEGAMKHGNLGDHLFKVLIPTEKVVTMRGGKKVLKERNLYSGYVFIEAELTGELIHEISNTTNVIDFLRGREKGAAPTMLSESDVKRMLGSADEHAEAENFSESTFLVGETVKVNEGPFSGFTGVIEEVSPDKGKLKVAVKVFGRPTALELDTWQVTRE